MGGGFKMDNLVDISYLDEDAGFCPMCDSGHTSLLEDDTYECLCRECGHMWDKS